MKEVSTDGGIEAVDAFGMDGSQMAPLCVRAWKEGRGKKTVHVEIV